MDNMSDKRYNISAQYEIIGRVLDSKSVIGYVLLSRIDGAKMICTRGTVEQLALDKNIYNATAQIYNNNVLIKGINCKLNQLPNYSTDGVKIVNKEVKNIPKIKLIGRIQTSRTTSSYIVEYESAEGVKRRTFTKQEILELARRGLVVNAKAQLNNGELMLRGINEDLGSLKTYRDSV